MHADTGFVSRVLRDPKIGFLGNVERNSQAIARLKTIWSFVAGGVALAIAVLKEWLFGQK